MEISELYKLFIEHSVVCTDTRKITKNCIFFALKGENFNGNLFAKSALDLGAAYAIVDEVEVATQPNIIYVKDALVALQALANYHRKQFNIPIIAITGSNGKTTTKELINAVLSKKYKTVATTGNLNNHIGVPLTILSITNYCEVAIIEMGANHPKEIEFLCSIAKPDYGLITNFGKAHLEGFGSVEGVIKGKSEIYDFLIKNNKTIFVNTNDPIQVEKTKQANRFTFGNNSSADVKIEFIEVQPNVKVQFNNLIINSHLIGEYNFNNIAVAIAIAKYFKIEGNAIKTGIENYTPNNNRSQVLIKGSNKIILDAYNANPTSMTAALLNFEKQTGNKVAIIGDMFELGEEAPKEHQHIADLAISLQIDQIIFVGENFYKTVTKSKKIVQFKTFDEFKNSFDVSEIQNATLLIKGSRGMALERVLELL